MTSERPGISVILATDNYETIRPVVDCLCRQTVKTQVELVIVVPERTSLGLAESDVDGLAGVRVVEVGTMEGFARARVTGIHSASAPIVVIGETHSYPHPSWAETLIEAHKQPWTVVLPGFGNANPAGALSWAAFLRDYGPWLAGLPAGEISMMPTHNASYKREVLLELGPGLERALTHGDQLNLHLRAHGYRVYFEPAARIDHLNISRPGAWLWERFLAGLLTAGQRAERWPWHKRLLYLAASPLIPVVILSKTRKGLRQARRQARLPAGTVPWLIVGAVVSALGELVGYARGAGSTAVRQMTEYELHKVRYVSPATLSSRLVSSLQA
jgi:hypothetical protein